MKKSTMLTIGKIATLTSVSTDTIRYYEREGLLLLPRQKSEGGYRLYNDEAITRIKFIKQAQSCGFSLIEISDLLNFKEKDEACCNDVRSLAIEKKLLLENKIKAFKKMSATLDNLITSCDDSEKNIQECPILTAFEKSL